MNFDDIFLFVKLINIGTFTELAKQLNVSQSTVSRRVQSLEESINTKLLKRNSRGVIEMTAEGESLYNNFSYIEGQAVMALQKWVNNSKQVNGILKVGIPKLFFDNILAPKLDTFYARYPHVQLIFSYTAVAVDLVKDNIDIAITTRKPTAHNCTIKTLIRAKNKLYASKKYIQEKGIPQTIKELENHRIVGFIDKDKCQNILVGFSEQDNSSQEVNINADLFLNNAIYDINLATKCNRIINVLDVFADSKANIEPVLSEYYFGKTSFYLIRATGVRSNLEREFVKFIDVCLQDKLF
ncbi:MULTISPECIES: LysR family transcriptional regulator [Francisella]|uniref:LysR family transcriptional regulator n=1 Tax=Francisella opportunistica TaxID=2016517 RepID=A0A345JQC6_9GAMM|nr:MULTISPECIES: LysR family transcriptional regulator [Francisella]APC91224.1 Transcriptional regulator [Francisella sp. MA067296]AXH29522.1 LysR family transcriptional regulator [Francisella opportunistica]AXH31173.1 LysR family transcriptional regulator [Francisella opportunistica]AXH32820.1 LysR family transcriptional regulator [Francisella opportunistica]